MSNKNEFAVPHPVGLFVHVVSVGSRSVDHWRVAGVYLNEMDAEAHAARLTPDHEAVLVSEAHQFTLLFGNGKNLERISDEYPFYVNRTSCGFGREVVIGVWSKREDAEAAMGRVTTNGPHLEYKVGQLVEQNRVA